MTENANLTRNDGGSGVWAREALLERRTGRYSFQVDINVLTGLSGDVAMSSVATDLGTNTTGTCAIDFVVNW